MGQISPSSTSIKGITSDSYDQTTKLYQQYSNSKQKMMKILIVNPKSHKDGYTSNDEFLYEQKKIEEEK